MVKGLVMAITWNNRPGFSLTDIIIAMGIMLFVGIFMVQFSLGSYTNSKEARSRHAACLSAEKKISELSLQAYAKNGSDKDTVDHVICGRQWTITNVNNMKRINVSVTYQTSKGTSRQVALSGVVK
jgi:Tfp pilus assembly protein PilV